MNVRRDLKATYENGVIRPEEPLPELEGLSLRLRLSFPHGTGETGEIVVKAVYPGPLVELGPNLAPMANGPSPLLVPYIKKIRSSLLRDTGFPLPPVRMLVTETLSDGAYRIWLNGTVVGQAEARMTRMLAIAPSEEEASALQSIAGDELREPVFGLPGKWILSSLEDLAQEHGLTVAPPAKMIANHLEESISKRLSECLSRDTVHALLDSIRERAPRLVDDALQQHQGVKTVHAVLRSLLQRKRHIGNLAMILEELADSELDDADALAEHLAGLLPAFPEQ